MMHIEIAARQLSGCTDFLPRPARLHLGSQNAEGVDVLAFALPPDWAGKSVSLHVERADGAPQTALLLGRPGAGGGGPAADGRPGRPLDADRHRRRGLHAYSQPGCFDTGEILAEGEVGEPPSPSLYEQFVAQVLDSAGDAASSAQAAAQSAGSASAAAGQGGGRGDRSPGQSRRRQRQRRPCRGRRPAGRSRSPRRGSGHQREQPGRPGGAGRLGRGGAAPALCPRSRLPSAGADGGQRHGRA